MEKSISGDGISEPFGQGIQTSLYCRGPDAETDRTKYEIPFGAVLLEEKSRGLEFSANSSFRGIGEFPAFRRTGLLSLKNQTAVNPKLSRFMEKSLQYGLRIVLFRATI